MTDPDRARATDKGRFYEPPAASAATELLPSVTNILGTGFTKIGLPKWYANNAADWALDHLPEVVARSRTDRDGVRADIADAAEHARDGAASLGTLVHALAEAHLLGTTFAPDDDTVHLVPEASLYVAQYLRFLKDFDIDLQRDVIAAEMSVAHPAFRYAGTLDGIIRLPLDGFIDGKCQTTGPDPAARKPWLFDIKTSRKRAATQTYPDNALQLAALRHAKEAWIRTPGGEYQVEPVPSVVAGAVLNLRPKSYAFIPVPCGTAEFKVFLQIAASCRWLYEEWPGGFDHRPVLPSGRFKPKRGTTNDLTSGKTTTATTAPGA